MNSALDCEPIVDSSLGQELEKDECQVLASVMKVRELKDGETLVKEGDKDNTLFVLTAGKLDVYSIIDNKEAKVYSMKVGEVAGTRAFVDRAPRKATLRANGNTTVYTLEPEAFEALLETQPRVVYKVMRGLFRITHMNLMRMNVESQALASYIHKTGGRF
jgi:CRP/FNR family cyclic AMP-dependent transcriptional regulator